MKAKMAHSHFKHVDVVEVFLWGQRVGATTLDAHSGYYSFKYDPAFVRTGIELAPIHMPLSKASDPFIFTDLPFDTYKRLPAMLADSLPDDFGNALINKYMAEKGVIAAQISPLDRLAYMGARAMGALEFKPARSSLAGANAIGIKLGELVKEARMAACGAWGNENETNQALRNIIAVGTSAGGARAKAVIALNSVTNEIKSGQGTAPEDFEHWLLKFDGLGADRELGSSSHFGRIEYAYYLMAKAAGIKISESRLLHENGRAHFITKRFDRIGNEKVFMQTFCALDHVDFKKKGANSYEQLMLLIMQLNLPYEQRAEAFRRMVFNSVTMNCDDHAKNFSFLMRQGEGWKLSPAYDVTFAHNPQGEWTRQHLMSINGKWLNHCRNDYLAVSNRYNIGEAEKIIDQIIKIANLWPEFAKQAELPEDIISRIFAFFKINIERNKKS